MTTYTTCLFVTHTYGLFGAQIYARLYENGHILGDKNPTKQERTQVYVTKKTHVYRVAGMIASIRGKKPHVYRVIILKQMAGHTFVLVNKTLQKEKKLSR